MNRIKLFIAVLVCRLATFASHKLGRGGSSIPGKIALKLVPDILKRIKLPETIIAVTGSNGKTSTVEMISEVLIKAGKKVAWNKEGSNQIEGAATFLLNNCSYSGKVTADVVVMETDERYARYTFRYFRPTHYVITNLYRDQLTRNGHPEWIYEAIKESIYPETELILNADDPLVRRFGYERNEENVLYFGAGHIESDEAKNDSIYNDGTFCPICRRRMTYDYYHYNHIGQYHCSCGYRRPDTTWTLKEADLDKSQINVNGTRIHLPFSSLYQCYNTMAAFAITTHIGVDPELAAKALGSYHTRMGRILRYKLANNTGTALLSKHENSVSYDQSIRVVSHDPRSSQVLIIVSSVSRKYFTSDTSWLWDIDFEKLNVPQVKRVVLTGTYCHDLSVRFRLAGFSDERLLVNASIPEAVKSMDQMKTDTTYVITCFADIDKFKTLDTVTLVEEDEA